MTWKNGRKIIAARRERVAQLRLRGLTQREIVEALPQRGMINPETGKPFGLGTIARDFLELDKKWRANAERNEMEHKAEHLEEVSQVKRAAWATGKLDTVLRALDREAKVWGFDAPLRVKTEQRNIDLTQLSNEQLERLRDGESIESVLQDGTRTENRS